jgi:hypothetical protein
MLVKAPGAPPYVVLLDDFNYRADYYHYLWLMNSEPGNRIELDQANIRATVYGREHRLEIGWSLPGPADYPLQHRLDLSHDKIDSFPLGHRKHDVNYFLGKPSIARPEGGGRWGAGVRPRLKAMLWGYNGQLLTVLVPRRKGDSSAVIQRIVAPAHFGLTLRIGKVTDTIVASPIDRRIAIGGIEGEATLAAARRNAKGELLWWAAADAYALSIDGQVLLPRHGEPSALCEGKTK